MSEFGRLDKWRRHSLVFEADDYDRDYPLIVGFYKSIVKPDESARVANLAIIMLLVQIKEERRRYS